MTTPAPQLADQRFSPQLRARHRGWTGVCSALLFLACGCGAAVRQVAKEAVPGAVEAGVESVSKAPLQQKLAAGVEQPAVREGSGKVAGGVLDAGLDVLANDERQARIEELTIERDSIGQRVVRTTVATTVEAALSPNTEVRVKSLVNSIVEEVIAALQAGLSPAMGTPEERLRAFKMVVRQLTKHVALGFQDAVDETREAKARGDLKAGRGGVLAAVGNAAEWGGTMPYALGGLVLCVLVAAALLRRSTLHHRQTLADCESLRQELKKVLAAQESNKPTA